MIGIDLFVFYKLQLPSTLLFPPCPTAVPASLYLSREFEGARLRNGCNL